jgi:hypothetical protein
MGMRQPSLDWIGLTLAERATLRRAADLLGRIHEERNRTVPVDWYAGDEDDSDLAFGWRICNDLAEDGRIDAESVASASMGRIGS